MKLKHIEVKCPVFKCDLHYIINCDYKEFNKYCKKKFELDRDENYEFLKDADGTTIILSADGSGDMYRVVWLEKFNMKHDKIGVLVHETTHAIIRILDWKGIPYSSEGNQDETFAYLMDYFISNFIYQFNNNN